MANLLLLMVCFLLGVFARRLRTLPEDSHRVLNAWVMWVSLPALVFRSIHGVRLQPELLLAASCLWLTFLLAAAVAWRQVRQGRSTPQLAGALALCAGLGNTAFIGLPLLEALGGREAVGPAALVDQLGSFVALFLFGVPFATVMGGARLSPLKLARRLVSAPPLLALLMALALKPWALPAPVETVVGRLADMLSPLALAGVGWQLDLSTLSGHGRRILLGLSWKLVAAPALVLALLLLTRGQLGLVERVAVAQAAMAPMVTAGVVAAENKLSAGLAAALIAVGVPLSFLTVPLWWLLTGWLA